MSAAFARALRLLGERAAKVGEDGSATVGAARSRTDLRLEPHEVARLLEEGLVARRLGRLVRTDAGRAYLRRAMATAGEDGFAAQHRERSERCETVRGERIAVETNAAECPLAWLATRRDRSGAPMITPTQYEAGRRLHADHVRGQARDRVTQSWDASGVRGEAPRDRLSVGEAALDARRRVEAALRAVGPGLAEVLLAVCCEEIGLEAAEKRFGWPARSGKVVLRLALDRLADHYGIGEAAEGSSRHRTVHWGAPDYRPRA